MPDPKSPAVDVRAALAAYRLRNPEGYEELTEYATCLAEEVARLQSLAKRGAPKDVEDLFTSPPDYDCFDTGGIVSYMLGYVKSAGDVLGIPPWEIVRVVTTQ